MKRRNSRANITDSVDDAGTFIISPICDDENYRWSAFYATPMGYVEMEARNWVRSSPDTWLSFIWRDKIYRRYFDRFYSRRYATRLAMEFARDVVEGRVE